MHSFTDPTTQ